MATSGPGATNLVTGIADAWMDNTCRAHRPSPAGDDRQGCISGNRFLRHDPRGRGTQLSHHRHPRHPARGEGSLSHRPNRRPGPVVITFENIQQQTAQPVWPTKIDLPGYRPDPKADDLELNEIIGLIEKAERPVLYVGGGIITGEASKELRAFSEATKIPVTTTIMGVGAFPEDHKLSLRWLGMHGAAYANWAVSGELRKDAKGNTRKIAMALIFSPLLVRFDDRVTGSGGEIRETGTIVHVDLDRSEHNKNRHVQLPIHSDVKYALGKLVKMVKARPIKARYTKWHKQIAEWKQRAPLGYKVTDEVMNSMHMKDHLKRGEDQVILPQHAIATLFMESKGDALSPPAWASTRCGPANITYKHPRQLITSAGPAPWACYPAALGVKVAHPNKEVDIDGDGPS